MICLSFLVLLLFRLITVTGQMDPCYRECGDKEMTCVYELNITLETSMNIFCKECPFNITDCSNIGCIPAGGIARSVLVANNMLPGPPIMVCENDTIQVTVRNKLRSDTTSIHWHGIHQVGTFFMDGLPLISQYTILPSDFFKYEFKASPHGTHIWHGHSSFQEADGLFGALIVRRKEPETIKQLYDYDLPEHIVTIWHWYDKPTENVLVPILHRNSSVIGFGFLINGKASFKDFQNGTQTFNTPRETFYVKQGIRYRFRLMFNSAIYCAVQVSVDNHRLKVIASETSYFEPVDVDTFMVGAGDRFDFVFNAVQESGCYAMRFRGTGDCGPPKAEVHELAYVCYFGSTLTFGNSTKKQISSSYQEANRNGTMLNPFEIATYSYENKTLLHFVDLKNTEPVEQNYSGVPDLTYYVEIQSSINENARFPGAWHQFNNISFIYPSIEYIRNKFNTDEVCTDETKAKYCVNGFCSCTYTKRIPKGSLVEIVLVDLNTKGIQDHPVHMHGYKFHIVAMEGVGSNININDIKGRNENGTLKKNLQNAISKDTVSVPNRGYAILRFVASNIGVWLLHCHVTNHMELGMAMLLQVGPTDEIMGMCENSKQCGDNFGDNSAEAYRPCALMFITIFICFFFGTW